MKKSLLFGFAVALTLASCTTNDDVLDTAMQTPMEFSSFVNKGTKAPVDDLNFNESTFGVWGYKGKNTETASIPVFATQGTLNGSVGVAGNENDLPQTVNCSISENSAASWTYTDLRYWDKTCNYMFLAYAPVKKNINAKINANKQITITDFTVNDTIAKQIDLMVSQPLAFAKGTTGNGTEGKVKFNFYHTLTKVNVQFNKSAKLNGAAVILRTAELKGIKSIGTYTTVVSTADNFGSVNNGSWSDQKTDISFRSLKNIAIRPTEGETINTTNNTLSSTDNNYLNMFEDMLMIPQSFNTNAFTLDLNYTINGEEFTRTIDMGKTAWSQNMSILYTLTIDADEIIFDNPSVSPWAPVTGSDGTITDNDSDVSVPNPATPQN